MRASRTLLPALLLAALILAGTAGAQRTSTHIDYWWSGSAFQVDLLYAQTTRGLSLANRDSKEMVWYASCEHRYPGVHPGGNPFNDACEAPTFSSPDPGKRYFISIFTGWGSGPRREHWTGTAQPGLGLARTTATFDGELDVGIWSGVPNRSAGEQILVAVKDMLAGWWTSLADGFASSAPPKIFSPTGGTLDVTATAGARQLESTAAAPVFTVHQSLRGGGSTPLRVSLTSAGRAYARDPSRVPVVTLAMSFRGATLRATITPRLVPSIASVEFRGKPADPTIVVRGRGLAPLPPKSPSGSPVGHDGCPAESGDYGSDYGLLFNLNDLTKGWSAGTAFAARQ